MDESENGHLFQVHVAGMVLQGLKELTLQAAQAGRGEEFVAALEVVYERLRKRPKEFGEPLFRLPALKLTVYLAATYPLAVQYGVHDHKPLVFLRSITDISE